LFGLKRRFANSWFLVLVPSIVVLLCFFVVPLAYVVGRSIPDYSLKYYVMILTTPVYVKVIFLTFKTSILVTFVCLLLGYPYAYAMSRAQGWLLIALSIALLLPFWVSFLLRTFAWMILLQDTGLINKVLIATGIINEPIGLIRSTVGVTIGMAHILLPYVVLPIYAVMRRIDHRLMDAASISGARPVRAFCRVYFPLSLPGVYAAAVLAFTLGLGFYITPALLGSSRNTMIGQLIAEQIGEQLNFEAGSAMAVILLILTGMAFGFFGVVQWLGKQRLALTGMSH